MNIQTKFQTGDTVWFYDKGEVNKAKIVHVEINLNGGEKIEYTVDRKDKTYTRYHDYGRYYLSFCSHDTGPSNVFLEEDIANSKDDLRKILQRKENERHNKEMEKINSL